MKIETLEKAKELQDEIRHLTGALKEMERNELFISYEWCGNYETYNRKIANIDDETKRYILDHFKNKKELFEKELEEL